MPEELKAPLSPHNRQMWRANRRDFLSTVVMMTTMLAGVGRWAMASGASLESSLPLPLGEEGDLSLEEFLALSRVLTGKHTLRADVAERILQLYRMLPDRMAGLSALYQHIAAAAGAHASGTDLESWRPSSPLLDRQASNLLLELVEHWYTGIYWYGDREELITYWDALMYEPCSGIHPIPGSCGGEFGFWTRPPEGYSEGLTDAPVAPSDQRETDQP